jgi:hypothetical protein
VGACENLRPEFNSELYGDWWPDDFPVNPIHNAPMADDADQVVAFSSRGPTQDDRIKPDVVAPGTFILSTRSTRLAPNNFAWKAYPPNKSYFFMGGTSMATPLTSGAVGLIREFLRKERGLANPSAALLKATLLAGAQRLPKTAPAGTIADPHQGFGRVNLDRSLKSPLCTLDGPALKTGEKSTTVIAVATGGKSLRIAMCYSDSPGEPGEQPELDRLGSVGQTLRGKSEDCSWNKPKTGRKKQRRGCGGSEGQSWQMDDRRRRRKCPSWSSGIRTYGGRPVSLIRYQTQKSRCLKLQRRLLTDKVFPADGPFSLQSRREAVPTENVPTHRLIG